MSASPLAAATVGPGLDEDELWAVYTALAATCEFITQTDEDTQLVMDLQDEAHALVADVVARRLVPFPLAGKLSQPAGGPVTQPAGGSS